MERRTELVIALILAGIFLIAGYFLYKQYFPKVESVLPTPPSKACTLEAKMCPDGSYVGRAGPNCEFSPCP